MSQAGKGKPNHIPGIRTSKPNGDTPNEVTPNLVWDEDNPPVVFACTNDSVHHPRCDGNCPSQALPSELAVELLNEAKEYMRLGANFMGVPAAVQDAFGMPGLRYDGFDLMCRIDAVEQLLIEHVAEIDQMEIDEKYRAIKLKIMRDVRLSQERKIKEQRTKDMLGIPSGLLGPDGQRLQ